MPNRRALSATAEKEACQLYLSGQPLSAVGRQYAVHPQTVLNILHRHGMKARSQSEGQRRYRCNHSFFDVIDTEAKAYWLGFLGADGCVYTSNHSHIVSLALAEKDRQHVYSFREHLGSNHPIRTHNRSGGRGVGTPLHRIVIRSAELATALREHGVVSRKTFTLEWPSHLRTDLARHYLRGYFDGDGHVTTDHRRGYLVFGLTCNQSFFEGVRDYLVATLGVSKRKPSRSPGREYVGLTYTGAPAVRICRWMYQDATVYMPRKRAKAEQAYAR